MLTLDWKGWGAAEQWRGDQQLHGTIKLHRQSWGTESLLVLWQKKVHSAQKFGRWARVRCKGSRHWVYRAVCIEAPTRHTQLAYPDHPQPWWRFYLPPAKKLQKKKTTLNWCFQTLVSNNTSWRSPLLLSFHICSCRTIPQVVLAQPSTRQGSDLD